MKLKLDLDPKAWDALVKSAAGELHPAPMQAEVLLRRALGLPVPLEPRSDAPKVGVSHE